MNPDYIKIYLDKDLKILMPIHESKPQLDLAVVDGGSSRKYSFFIENRHPYAELHDIKLSVDNSEVSILKCPSQIGISESAEFEVEWNADVTIERGIKPNFKLTYNLICS